MNNVGCNPYTYIKYFKSLDSYSSNVGEEKPRKATLEQIVMQC